MECNNAEGFTRGSHGMSTESMRYDSHCHEMGLNACFTQDMKDQRMQMFEIDHTPAVCSGSCDMKPGMEQEPGMMRCRCVVGSHPVFIPNCDPAATTAASGTAAAAPMDCLQECACDDTDADMVNGECVCREQNMIMTFRGCRPEGNQ
jgi:hypothetical protein